jgi:hypothetical protein
MKPHKHAELIKAWADGAEIEIRTQYPDKSWSNWEVFEEPRWGISYAEYRLKQEIPQWHKDIIQAINEGKEIQVFRNGDWIKSNLEIISWENPSYFGYYKESEYRIKPEPKPDVVKYANAWTYGLYGAYEDLTRNPPNLKLTFDGETGELKSAEVLK